jgi:hypothetical protein
LTSHDSITDDTPTLLHRLFFKFQAYPPTAEELGPHHNRAIHGDVSLDGIDIHYTRHKGGAVILHSERSRYPLLEAEIPAFMQEIWDNLPFYTPPIEEWRITGCDVHLDVDTTEPRRRHIDFYHNGVKGQAYNKPMPGGRRVLRVELQISPDVTLADFSPIVRKTKQSILEVFGK